MPKMSGFRWDISQDISLCVEVRKVRPDKAIQWSEVAESLNGVFSNASVNIYHNSERVRV